MAIGLLDTDIGAVTTKVRVREKEEGDGRTNTRGRKDKPKPPPPSPTPTAAHFFFPLKGRRRVPICPQIQKHHRPDSSHAPTPQATPPPFTFTQQVAVTGRSGVGKTALINHASCGDWVGSFPETLGTCVTRASSSSSSSNNHEVEGGEATSSSSSRYYDFWEVGGRYAAKFPYAVKAQLHAADVIVHVFAFTDRTSLHGVSKEVANLRSGGGGGGGGVTDALTPAIILVGTKRDCVSTCQLSLEEAQNVAAECNVPLVLVDSPAVEPEDVHRGGGGRRIQGNSAAAPLFEALQAATASNVS